MSGIEDFTFTIVPASYNGVDDIYVASGFYEGEYVRYYTDLPVDMEDDPILEKVLYVELLDYCKRDDLTRGS